MLKVVVAEKGSAEKELFFAADEVSIGRVQSNGIVLPRPNVSKRHAVLEVKAGHMFVNDLKSTNGTYVNGRRIVQARELTVDDRVYIGDFVLRLSIVEPDSVGKSDIQPMPSHDEQRASTIAMPAFNVDMPPPPFAAISEELDIPPMPELPDSVVAEASELVAPPDFEFEVETDYSEPEPEPEPLPDPTVEPEPRRVFVQEPEPPVTAVVAEPAPLPYQPPVVAAPMKDEDSRSAISGLARRLGYDQKPGDFEALRTLADYAGRLVFNNVDPATDDFSDEQWQKLSDGVMKLVDQLRREDRIPRDVDPFAITQQILFEFAGLGPLEELLSMSSVKAIVVSSLDSIYIVQDGKTRRVDSVFSNQATFGRVVTKLCGLAGLEASALNDPIAEGRLPDGSLLQIIGHPFVDDGRMVVIERPVAKTLSIDELIDGARITEEAADAIRSAVRDRRNIVVCGAPSSGRSIFVNALVNMIESDRRVLVLGGRRELDLRLPNVMSMNKSAVVQAKLGGACVVINRVFPDYVVINGLECADTELVQDLGLAGRDGLILTMTASSAEDCVSRLKLMLQFASPGIDGGSVDALVSRIADIIVVLKVDSSGLTVVSAVFETNAPDSLKVTSSLSLVGMGVLSVDGE
jgi:pilus assembly protein CpaF